MGSEDAITARSTGILTPLLPIKRDATSQRLHNVDEYRVLGPSVGNPDLAEIASEAHERGDAIFTWVVDTREDVNMAIGVAADAIISNDPRGIERELNFACPSRPA